MKLELKGLKLRNPGGGEEQTYWLSEIARKMWDWDKVVRSSHLVNCWYNIGCAFNLYVKDGTVVREEQIGCYPPPNDPNMPDLNPKGCQKGVCYGYRQYDPTRLKYPLKRVGARGEGKWQRASWDQALTEIADTLIDVLSTEGEEVIVAFRGAEGVDSLNMGHWTLVNALGLPWPNIPVDEGDEHPGASLTWGKAVVAGSADDWFYADIIFVWGGNPAYTYIPLFHFITEARYHGVKVVVITPDYNPSAPFADLWVPINIGTDAALALSMAQVIISKGLHKPDFIREQTDLPLLVRTDTHKFLTQKDMQQDGRDNRFCMFDQTSRRVVNAPHKTLALGNVTPALEGEYEVNSLQGRVKVKPVFQLLKERLRDYTPEKAAAITGVHPRVTEQMAMEFASASGVVNISSANWGKFYHGDLMERAQILLWALCGHFGRRGACWNAFPMLAPDTTIGYIQRRGTDLLLTAKTSDPRYTQWQEDGYSDEMILHQYAVETYGPGNLQNMSIFYHLHGGLLDITSKNNNWDPCLKRPIAEYLKESLGQGWQVALPRAEKEPRIIFEHGGSFLRGSRGNSQLFKHLLPKLKLLVTEDIRMGTTALYSDYVLPCAANYERYGLLAAMPMSPYLHLNTKAVEPVGEAKSTWEIVCLLARKIQERAVARGTLSFTDRLGRERRLDNLYDQITVNGLYTEEDEEAVVRDMYLNTNNVERMEWEDFKEKGIARMTGLMSTMPDSACDMVPGEPIVPFTYHVRDKQVYPTLTRRMQFYIDHDWFLELGEALPTYKDNPKVGGDYPLQLVGGHARWSIHSVWKDTPILLRLQRGEPLMFMSLQDAGARNIADGDWAQVFNDVASTEVQVAVSPALKPGQVIIYHDWENFQFKGRVGWKSLSAAPLNPVELVGGYGHINPRAFHHYYGCQPGANDRDTRVEVRRLERTV